MRKTTPRESDADHSSLRLMPPRGDRQPTVSYLVRFWLEPREGEGESCPFRGYSRDLHTGEERYFGDPRRFAEHVLRQLRAEQTANELHEIEDAIG